MTCCAGGGYLRRTAPRGVAVTMFEDLKQNCLDASDFELHFAALVVFNELTTRRLGGNMALDASGNAVVLVPTPGRKVRAKTPKKAIAAGAAGGAGAKQEDVQAMFQPPIVIGDDVELGEVSAPPFDSQETESREYQSVSPDPPSDPIPVPKEKKVPIPKPRGAMRH